MAGEQFLAAGSRLSVAISASHGAERGSYAEPVLIAEIETESGVRNVVAANNNGYYLYNRTDPGDAIAISSVL
jgi:hypothetical protein